MHKQLLMLTTLSFMLIGCSDDKSNLVDEQVATTTTQRVTHDTVSTAKEDETITYKLPYTLLATGDSNNTYNMLRKEGVADLEKTLKGDFIFTLTPEVQQRLLDKVQTSLDGILTTYFINNQDNPFEVDFQPDNNIVTFYTEQSKENFDENQFKYIAYTLGTPLTYYRAYKGVDTEKNPVHLRVVHKITQEEYSSYTYKQ